MERFRYLIIVLGMTMAGLVYFITLQPIKVQLETNIDLNNVAISQIYQETNYKITPEIVKLQIENAGTNSSLFWINLLYFFILSFILVTTKAVYSTWSQYVYTHKNFTKDFVHTAGEEKSGDLSKQMMSGAMIKENGLVLSANLTSTSIIVVAVFLVVFWPK